MKKKIFIWSFLILSTSFIFSCNGKNGEPDKDFPIEEIKYNLNICYFDKISNQQKLNVEHEIVNISKTLFSEDCKEYAFIPNDFVNIIRLDLNSNKIFKISTDNCYSCSITRTITGATLENSENLVVSSLRDAEIDKILLSANEKDKSHDSLIKNLIADKPKAIKILFFTKGQKLEQNQEFISCNDLNILRDTITDILCKNRGNIQIQDVYVFVNPVLGDADRTITILNEKQYIDFMIFSLLDSTQTEKVVNKALSIFKQSKINYIYFNTTDLNQTFSFSSNQINEFKKKLIVLLKQTTKADFNRFKYLFANTFDKYRNTNDTSYIFLIGQAPDHLSRIYNRFPNNKSDFPKILLSVSPLAFQSVIQNVIQDIYSFETIK